MDGDKAADDADPLHVRHHSLVLWVWIEGEDIKNGGAVSHVVYDVDGCEG